MDKHAIPANSPVAVIGAGAMGTGIAQVAAQVGHPVILIDTSEEALERSRQSLDKSLAGMVERGRVAEAEAAELAARIVRTTDMARASTARLAIEAVVERLEVKRDVFARLAAAMAEDAVLASNTSSLSIGALAAGVPHPERFIGLHFFNPVPVMKLVEVIPGTYTAPATVEAAEAAMQRWGKIAARVRDVPGFIVNRVARPYYAEAFAAWGEGIPAAKIDAALESAGGFRMGPLALTDLIGQDVNYGVAANVHDGYRGKTRFRLQPAQRALTQSGKLGRKSGEGVYTYPAGRPEPTAVVPAMPLPPVEVTPEQREIVPLVAALRAQGVACSLDARLGPDTLRVGGVVLAVGDGRTLSERGNTDVLLDHVRDFAAASRVPIAARTSEAAAAAAALFAAVGKQALALPDRPGLLVLRTLAQLANAAADAVVDDVASAADIDRAMRFGANHPEGPLEWAERFGRERVADVLQQIAQGAGDAIYSPSPFFRTPKAGWSVPGDNQDNRHG
ncbi:3-hydroxyacyl-CoA dehydrogenase [Altererythrobacter soli]|uniref:3-hydroxyacyl-CoA dehydrogenase n=1 Tax=Croceibacterium soli TaxID=1739690 RepID=A0A6I4UV16_9SPHN|nr:3-hydroxyacyl-CoA dehydrogenase NAD-binding domain-containing protein [Croceibacterium soli]MXP41353.1 3-hydroxyacyl-CoA dehydrogenase [Croceibacterium soli]